jgi:predicted HicB family RNase H-like nuclease
MNDNTIKIVKKEAGRGEDGYKVFSVRVKEETVSALEVLAEKSNRSRNELINIMLEYGVNHSVIEE